MSSRFVLPFADVGNGIKPEDGAQLFFFRIDGVTPKDTFSDQLSTPTVNANPVIADSNGVFSDIYIDGSYKVTLKDKNDVQIFGGAVILSNDNYNQGSASAVDRTITDRLKDIISIKDFGGSDLLSDNLAAINNAVSSLPNGGEILFPDDGNSVYAVSAKPNGGPGYVFRFAGEAKLSSIAFYPDGTNTLGFNQQGTETTYELTRVVNDTVDQVAIAGSKVNGKKIIHEFGSSTTKGGRHALFGLIDQKFATSATNPDRNYVAVVGQALGNSSTGDGGTDTSTGSKGALFGCNFITVTESGYINLTNVTAGELNTKMKAGSSCKYHSILQLVTDDAVKGTETDCGLAIASKPGSVGLANGILFTAANGGNPIDPTTGTLIGTQQFAGSLNAFRGIDLSAYVFSGDLFRSNEFTITGNGQLELGQPAAGISSFIDFHSGTFNIDFDARIVATGGTASNGQATLTYNASVHVFDSLIRPINDNTVDIGTGIFRIREIFAANTVINGSDERLKTDISAIPDETLDVWSKIPIKRYRWIDAKAEKGDKARWHVGRIAQDIVKAFEDAGLNAYEWAVLCFDKWDEQIIEHPAEYKASLLPSGQPEMEPKLNQSGEPVTKEVDGPLFDSSGDSIKIQVPVLVVKQILVKKAHTEVLPAGERYGIRYGEAAQLDAALDSRERTKLDSRIKALEL